MTVGVAIVHYNNPELTLGCLASIAEHETDPPPTVVVDNASPDGSGPGLRAEVHARGWSTWASVVLSDRNLGFAGGNTLAFDTLFERAPDTTRVHMLNPDTIVRPGAIDALSRFLDKHPDAGLVGSRLEDPDSTAQRSAFRFPTPIGEFETAARLGPVSRLLDRWVVAPPVRDAAHQTDWVAGASLMIRRDVLNKIGPLDDRYFMYYEEVDFCKRARAAGWSCWYEPASRVVHLVGQSSGVVHGRPKRRPPYWFASRRRYFRTHFGPLGPALADGAWLAGASLDTARRLITRASSPHPDRFVRDLLAHTFARPRGAAS